jgi:uncharacterized protein (DUF1330 family)
MSVYVVISYDVTDPERFGKYMESVDAIMGIIAKHGGEVVFVDPEAIYEKGNARAMNACFKFPSVEDFHAVMNDPNYAEAKAHREASTSNYIQFIAKEPVIPQE